MTVRRLQTWMILGLLLLLAPACQAAQQAKTEKVFIFTQRDIILGHVKLYLGKSGIKCTMDKYKCELVAKAPNWNFSYYNPLTKTEYQRSYALLKEQPLFSWTPEIYSPGKGGKQVDVTVNGLPAIEISRHTDIEEERNFGFMTQDPTPVQKITRVYYTAYDDKKHELPLESVTFVEALFNQAHLKRLPIRIQISYEKEGDRRHLVMQTYKMETAMMPVSMFERPKGYKQAKTELDIASSDRTGLMEGWIQDMGFGEKRKAGKY